MIHATKPVPNGRNVTLLGGNVSISGENQSQRAGLHAWGGQVAIGAVGGVGTVNLTSDGGLSFLDGVTRADVSFDNRAVADVSFNSGGHLTITARNINILNGSVVQAGIDSGGGTATNQAGDLTLDATENIRIAQNSLVLNDVNPSFAGNSGRLNITANTLLVSDRSLLSSDTYGQGNTGGVFLAATDRIIFRGNGTGASSRVQQGATGNSGGIVISTGSLLVEDGAQLTASTFSRGNAGDIRVNARDTVTFRGFSGRGSSVLASGARSNVFNNAIGNSGDIEIVANSVSVSNGAQLQAIVFQPGQGNAGDITVSASDTISLDGFRRTSTGANASSGLYSRIETDETASARNGWNSIGGNIRLMTNSLLITNNAQVSASTRGQGTGGNISVRANDRVLLDRGSITTNVSEGAVGNGGNIDLAMRTFIATNDAFLQAATFGKGNAGNITINTRERTTFDLDSSANSRVGLASMAVGNGGNIRINTGSLVVSNGSALVSQTGTTGGSAGDIFINAHDSVSVTRANFITQTFGAGKAGDIFINAGNSVRFRGDLSILSGTLGSGGGGNISISTRTLSIANGSRLAAVTANEGNAGSIILTTHDRILLSQGALVSTEVLEESSGNAGNIQITTGSRLIRTAGQLDTSTEGEGNAGNIIIRTRERISFDGGNSAAFSSASETSRGNGGDIHVITDSLSLVNGSQLLANTRGRGNAGNIIIQARDRILLNGVDREGRPTGLLTTTSRQNGGRGGDISINTDSLEVSDGAVINAQTFNNSRGGNIFLNANTFSAISGGQIITTTSGRGRAGSIILNILDRAVLSGSDPTYSSRVARTGRATLNQGSASGLFVSTTTNSSGQGGDITINANELIVDNRATIAASSQGNGTAGRLAIIADTIQLGNRSIITTETSSSDGGNITFNDVDVLLLRDRSFISSTAGTARAGGNGGNITINANSIVAVPSEDSNIRANAFQGNGGRVELNANLYGITVADRETSRSDITATSDRGVQGEINVNPPNVDPVQGLVELPGDTLDASNQVAAACPQGRNATENLGSFVVTGRGGLPDNPTENLDTDTTFAQWITATEDGEGVRDRAAATPLPETSAIVEAQGWVRDAAGQVKLVTALPTDGDRLPMTAIECSALVDRAAPIAQDP